jgi:hypothetical protein
MKHFILEIEEMKLLQELFNSNHPPAKAGGLNVRLKSLDIAAEAAYFSTSKLSPFSE